MDDTDGTRSLISAALLRQLSADIGEGRFETSGFGASGAGQLPGEVAAHLEARGVSVNAVPHGALEGTNIVINLAEDEGFAPDVHPNAGVVEAHWPTVDPMAFEPAARERAISDVFEICRARVDHLVRLPTASLEERQAIQTIATNAKPEIHPEDYPASYGVTTKPEPT